MKIQVIGGAGHVGLPFALVLWEAGHDVTIVDTNERALKTIGTRTMPFIEHGADEILKSTAGSDRWKLAITPEDSRQCDWTIICIGTPVDEYGAPRIEKFVNDVLAVRRNGSPKSGRFMIRSSVAFGTMAILQRASGWDCLCYCPERIVQGRAVEEIRGLPQIIGSYPEDGVSDAVELFRSIGVDHVIHCLPEEAELAKLMLNAWRYITFAVANQFFRIAEGIGVDYSSVHRAMTDGYDRARGLPGPGFAAGPCLLKDTSALGRASPDGFPLGQAAMNINETLPDYLVDRFVELASENLNGQRDARVLLLGMAFKADIDDTRDSLAFRVRKLLVQRGFTVTCHDPFIEEFHGDAQALINEARIIIVCAPHSEYGSIRVPSHVALTLDLWRILEREPFHPTPESKHPDILRMRYQRT